MGNKKWTEDYFRKQLRDGRERRGWTQEQFANLLSDRAIPMHWTTVAKIEKGDRSVRIDEAAVIADIFEISLDALLGRNVATQRDQVYALQAALQTAAYQAPGQISAIEASLHERLAELEEFEFDERTAIAAEWKRAAKALAQARDALVKTLSPLRDAVVAATASQVIRSQIAEMGIDEAES